MNPNNQSIVSNKLADWVNDAPSVEVSAVRYNQVIHGVKPNLNPVAAPRSPMFRIHTS